MAARKVKPEEGVAQTVIENETEDAPKTVNLKSPWGSKVTVDSTLADVFKGAGFSSSK